MKSAHKELLLLFTKAFLLIILQNFLSYWLVEKQVVATLFAAGSHVPLNTAVLALTFLIIRLWVLVYLPGMLLARLGLIIWKISKTRHSY